MSHLGVDPLPDKRLWALDLVIYYMGHSIFVLESVLSHDVCR